MMADVVGFEGLYVIYDTGQVFSLPRKDPRFNKFKRVKTRVHRYEMICLTKNGFQHTSSIHRQLALAFIPNPDNKPYVNHKNGIKSDNRIENLEWVTALENSRHAIDTGLFPKQRRGQDAPVSKLTDEQVIAIKKDIRSPYFIARDYPVSEAAIRFIKKGRNWSHIKV